MKSIRNVPGAILRLLRAILLPTALCASDMVSKFLHLFPKPLHPASTMYIPVPGTIMDHPALLTLFIPSHIHQSPLQCPMTGLTQARNCSQQRWCCLHSGVHCTLQPLLLRLRCMNYPPISANKVSSTTRTHDVAITLTLLSPGVSAKHRHTYFTRAQGVRTCDHDRLNVLTSSRRGKCLGRGL